MQKLLICLACAATLASSGCSTTRDTLDTVGAAIPNALARTPLMYRTDVQQGNVISQDAVNQLKPGMTRSQVRFVMGTPMIADAFHEDRWDYVYRLRKGNGDLSEERLTVYFENDRLARVSGDYRPDPEAQPASAEREQLVDVPDYEGSKKGIITRALETVGLKDEDQGAQPESEDEPPPEATPQLETQPQL